MWRPLSIFKIFAMLLLIFVAAGCYDYKESLVEDITIYNALAEDSGIEIFSVDSIVVKNNEVKFYFETDLSIVPDTTKLKRVVIFKDGEPTKYLDPGNYSYFVDINVVPGKTYIYQFALQDFTTKFSKLSKKYQVKL